MTDEKAPHEVQALANAVRHRRVDAQLSRAALALRVGYSRQHVSNAERASKGLPSEGLVRALDSALDTGGALSDLRASAVRVRHARRMGVDNDGIGGEDVNRKQFLQSAAVLGVTALIPQVGGAETSGRPRIGPTDLDRLEVESVQLLAMGQNQGSGSLMQRAAASYSHGRRLLDQADYAVALEKRLTAIVAELARRSGWLSYDNGDTAEAQAYYSDSLYLGQQANDPELMAKAMANMAHLSLHLAQRTVYRGHARDAARLGEGALSLMRYHESPHLHALLSSRVARARAWLGDRGEAKKFIGKAWREIERAQDVPSPHWLSFVTESEITFHDGMVRADLGDPANAIELLQRSVSTQVPTPDPHVAISLHARAQLAFIFAQHGDLSSARQEAVVTAAELENNNVQSKRTYDLLVDVSRLTDSGEPVG